MSFIGNVLGILITLAVGYLIFKKYKPHTVLLAAGLLLLLASQLLGIKPIFPPDEGTGFILFDAFEALKNSTAKNVAAIGMIIMSAGGYAEYMNHIGAGEAMVRLCVAPLKKIGSPYLVLALAYTIGQILNIFIPSAAGLAVLLMATIYPILTALGVSRLSAVSVIATTACLDLGPASGATNIASETSAIDTMVYFVKYQMSVAIPIILVITAVHFMIQKRADKALTAESPVQADKKQPDTQHSVPACYALLPVIPLILLMVFNDFVVKSVSMNVVTAMLISLCISMILEIFVKRSPKETCKGIQAFFNGMGKQFATTVTLIIAAELFSNGLQAIGLINTIIEGARNMGFGAVPMTVIMVIIISATAFVTGSGNAAFLSFSAVVPAISQSFGVDAVVLCLSMQLAAGIARSMSPVASCVIAPAAYAEVAPMEVAKRTFVPMLAGIIVLLVCDFIFFL